VHDNYQKLALKNSAFIQLHFQTTTAVFPIPKLLPNKYPPRIYFHNTVFIFLMMKVLMLSCQIKEDVEQNNLGN